MLTGLHISKWTDAFSPSGTSPNPTAVLHASFIDNDPDSFKVRVTDPTKAGSGSASVKLSSLGKLSSYNNPEVEVKLTETDNGTGVFESPTLILVSSYIDDQEFYEGEAGAISSLPDDAQGDRTFISQLGGKVHINYDVNTTTSITGDILIPIKGSVKLNVVILNDSDGPVISNEIVEEYISNMKECFSQVGIKITATLISKNDKNLPPLIKVLRKKLT
jgi:hypothetical protein